MTFQRGSTQAQAGQKRDGLNVHLSVALLGLIALSSIGCTEEGTLSTASEEFIRPTLQGQFIIEELRNNDQRELALAAAFTDYDDRYFFVEGLREYQIERCARRFEPSISSAAATHRAIPPLSISAGSLIVTNSAGTLATLTDDDRTDRFPSRDYVIDSFAVSEEQTTGMTLDITGSEYPAMASIPIQDIDSIENMQPAPNSPITASTTLSWEPSRFSNTSMLIIAEYSNGIDRTIRYCTTADDGSFALTDIDDGLDSDKPIVITQMSRRRDVGHYVNDAYLVLVRYLEYGI